MAETALLTPLGWLAAPLFRTLFDKAHHHLGTGIDEKMKILQATVLPRLSLAIERAEKSPNKGKLVDWLKRLKGAYYEAEEAIDLFEYELLKKKVKHERKTQEQKKKNERGTRISSPSQFVPQRLKIASIKLKYGLSVFSRKKAMLKYCIDKLIEIAKEANEFRDLLEVQENPSNSDTDRETISEPPSRVFGRERDKENIVWLLTEKPLNSEPGPSTRPPIPTIAIMGRSGVGKTALAQYVYKDMDGHDHFDLRVWVHTPRKFKATKVIQNMIEIINAKERARNDISFTSLEALLTQIGSMLASKKLLLVLDDFWCDGEDFVKQWEHFIGCLSSCLPGSKILLTTQSKNAAQQAVITDVTEVETYYLGEIKEDQFSDLFMHYAWGPNNKSNLNKGEFEKIGREIAFKLKGDPGAAKLVGHQLSGKLILKHWEEVAQKDWLGDNMKARIWSYQQLPPDLQRCFAICSLFPKSYELPYPYIIELMMADGFIRPTDEQERLEDVGENYMKELVSRFFIEEVVDKEKGEIYYQLHDLLHDLAEHVQGDDFIRIDSTNFREVPSHINKRLFRSEICQIRHIFLPSRMINELKEKLCLMTNICTFFVEPDGVYVPKKVLQEILKNMKKLRVLSLLQSADDLPDSIGTLKHLRYLHINVPRPFKKLPDSICKLYHLQLLFLPNCESLPKYFSELISLRHFDTFGETRSHISHIGRLTSLQDLDQFVVRKKCGYELHQLENLNQLRGNICIKGLENVRSTADALKANMRNKKNLKKLEFEWNSDDTNNVTSLCIQHVQLLEALQPHPNISALTLKGFGGDRFPNWFLHQNSLRHLTSLILYQCDNIEEILSIEESLPNCKTLELWSLKNFKRMSSLPPNLNSLKIGCVPQLSFFSDDDLLMKEERKQYKLEVVKKMAESMKLEHVPLSQKISEGKLLQFMKERLQATPEICFPGSQYGDIYSEIVKCDPSNDDYSRDQLLDVLAMFMHYYIEIMFNKNEESKLILPSSLSYLRISSCCITSDALSTCLQCLVSLSELELSDIQTIISLPPKEVLCSLKNLKSLAIRNCYLLSSLGGIGALTSMIALLIYGCRNLNTSNEPLPSCLETIEFYESSNVDVLLSKSNLSVLRVLAVSGTSFSNSREVLHIGHLSCLEYLEIINWDGCLEGLNSLTSLNGLWVTKCPEMNLSSPMDKYTSALHQQVTVDNLLVLKLILSNETISSIEYLKIYNFQGDSPDDEVYQSLTSLKSMAFMECNITHLPKNLKNVASLRYMYLENCPNLCELELEDLPMNFSELGFKDCPTLTERFNKAGPYSVWFYEGSTIVTFPTQVIELVLDVKEHNSQILRKAITNSGDKASSCLTASMVQHS
ncbi:disease resistance protein RGA2-like [Carex rostrata]